MIEILTGDFRELSRDLADDSVDLVLTDPPYPKEYLPLWEDLGRVAARVLKPGKFLIAYSGHLWLAEVMTRLNKHLTYYWFCGLRLPGPRTRFWSRKAWVNIRPIVIYAKEPVTMQPNWFADYLTAPAPDKKYHKWGQAVGPIRYLTERFTEPGDLVFDPFLGGGTTAVACAQSNRRFIGYEIEPGTAEDARRRVARERLFVPQHAPVQLSFGDTPRCKHCGAMLKRIERLGRKREYCNAACRMAAFRNRQRREPKPGYIYLLSCKEGHCKIGCTIDPDQRLDKFSVLPPFNFKLDHLIPTDDMFSAESILHRKFAKKQTNGEWFKLTIDDIELIKTLIEYHQGHFEPPLRNRTETRAMKRNVALETEP